MYSISSLPNIDWCSLTEQEVLDSTINNFKETIKKIQSSSGKIADKEIKEFLKKLIVAREQLSNGSQLSLKKIDSLIFRTSYLLFTKHCEKVRAKMESKSGTIKVTSTADEEATTANTSWYIEKNEKKKGVYKPRLQAKGAIDGPDGSGARAGIPVGEEAIRECLASILNARLSRLLWKDPAFGSTKDFGVPFTAITAFVDEVFGENHEVGSYQAFAGGCKPMESLSEEEMNEIPEDELFKMALLDFITLNTDRHLKNVLVSNKQRNIFLIDHGACFPGIKSLGEISHVWMYAQFAQKPFSQKWIDFILKIDEKKLAEDLNKWIKNLDQQFPGNQMAISDETMFAFLSSIIYLKKCIQSRPDLTLFDYAIHLSQQATTFVKVESKLFLAPFDISVGSKKSKELLLRYETEYPDATNIDVCSTRIGGHFEKVTKSAFLQYRKVRLKRGDNKIAKMVAIIETGFAKLEFKSAAELGAEKLIK